MVPFSVTLSDLWLGFQGHNIFWSWISEKLCLKDKVTISQYETIPNIWNGTNFGDLDWPINVSRRFVSISWASCFCLSRSEAGTLFVEGVHSLCHVLWVDFDAAFTVFFRRDCSFRCTRQFSFCLSLFEDATIFAKLWSKITKSPKIGEKVCVAHFV